MGRGVSSVCLRTIFVTGDSVVISLPPAWLRGNGLRPGDRVELWYNGEVHVRPKPKEKEAADAVPTIEPTPH